MEQFKILTLISLLCGSCSTSTPKKQLEVVPHVDLSRYVGTWYEIVKLPAWFEKDCFGVTATYSVRDDGDIKVVNRCHKKALDGVIKEAVGKAWVVDKISNAKLRVRFFWPFAGDYWIIDLDDKNYQYAVVGDPGRNYFWVLSRTPKMNELLLNELLERAKNQGYNLEKLERTPQ
jgi:apolipoprotein D and lipocalin family protein